jgi:hypothetical protein
MQPGDTAIEPVGVPELAVSGPSLEHLAYGEEDGERVWVVKNRWLDVEQELALASVGYHLIDALWTVARIRYTPWPSPRGLSQYVPAHRISRILFGDDQEARVVVDTVSFPPWAYCPPVPAWTPPSNASRPSTPTEGKDHQSRTPSRATASATECPPRPRFHCELRGRFAHRTRCLCRAARHRPIQVLQAGALALSETREASPWSAIVARMIDSLLTAWEGATLPGVQTWRVCQRSPGGLIPCRWQKRSSASDGHADLQRARCERRASRGGS